MFFSLFSLFCSFWGFERSLTCTFVKTSTMYSFLVHFHSGWRWIFLVLLLIALINNFVKWKRAATNGPADQKWNLYAMSAAHLQLIVGFILYFMSPSVQFSASTMKDALLRFYTVEHVLTMVVAVILITIGYSRGKRAGNDMAKFRLAFWYFLGAFIFIIAGIPWPWRDLGGNWF